MTKQNIPQNALTQSNPLSLGFASAMKPAHGSFDIGFEAASERITSKLPRLVGASLIASGINTTDRQFHDIVAVLQMLVAHDTQRLLAPKPRPAKLPAHLRRWA